MATATKDDTLEKICPVCNGRSCEEEAGKLYYCYNCNGAGYVPTDSGKAILDLMRHNFSWMLRKRQELEQS